MADKRVTPLSSRVPIVDSEGNPTLEFMLKWQQQNTINNDIPVLPATPGDPTKFLSGTTPSTWLTPPDTTYGVVTASAAGLAPTLPDDATKFLNGKGAWAVPPGGGGGGSAVTVVQSATACQSGSNPTFTLGSAPTPGNAFLFLAMRWNSSFALGPGWQILLDGDSASGDVMTIAIKIVDGNDTSTVSPTTSGSGWSAALYEISGLTSVNAVVYTGEQDLSGSSLSVDVTSPASSSVAFGIFCAQNRSPTTVTLTGSPIDDGYDSSTSGSNGGGRSFRAWHKSVAKGSHTIGATFGSSGTLNYVFLIAAPNIFG